MNLIPWRHKNGGREVTPQRALATMRSEFDRLFDRFFSDLDLPMRDLFAAPGAWIPAFEVSETADEVVVRAELPGVDPKNVEVTVSGNVLTIAGEKREESEAREGVTYRCERRFGSFQRSIELPAAVDADKVRAENVNGVLTVRLPLTESSKPRRIKVLATDK